MERLGAERVRKLREGLLFWYEVREGSSWLFWGGEDDALCSLLWARGARVICASSMPQLEAAGRGTWYDGIFVTECIEREADPVRVLTLCHRLLREDGVFFLAAGNRRGFRYLCGERDPYTGRSFDGVEDYVCAYASPADVFAGRMRSDGEWKALLSAVGWQEGEVAAFSVMPGLDEPYLMMAEGYRSDEDLSVRLPPSYRQPETVFLEEEHLYDSFMKEGLFHPFANAFLYVCGAGPGRLPRQVTSTMDRAREDALVTVVYGDRVEKRAVYPEGAGRLQAIYRAGEDLAQHGIPVVPSALDGDRLTMPVVAAPTGLLYMKGLLKTDPEAFVARMDRYRDLVLSSSEHLAEDDGAGSGVLLARGYADLVFQNSFYDDGTFRFFDQEFCEERFPANFILWRAIATIGLSERGGYHPEALLRRYGLDRQRARWVEMDQAFNARIRQADVLKDYRWRHTARRDIINANRQRMNYAEEDYQRLFVDIFRHADTRKLVLFGSGRFAERFLSMYQADYPVACVVDNQSARWGKEICGVEIVSPDALRGLAAGTYKVIICIKDYLSVMKQLDTMGVTEYSIFDPSKDYPRKRHPIAEVAADRTAKKYHVGYIAGVFDLFHVGHVRLFARAKALCDYLIVGVVSDEGVRKYKKVEPFIPFDERLEMVASCRLVDEAVGIPEDFADTEDAWKMHHFDVQFSGSDYADDDDWRRKKAFLEAHGADLVFFPYTEETSSTKIKGLIEEKLL